MSPETRALTLLAKYALLLIVIRDPRGVILSDLWNISDNQASEILRQVWPWRRADSRQIKKVLKQPAPPNAPRRVERLVLTWKRAVYGL